MQGREENIFKGAGEGFQQFYVLTFPSILKNERKEEEKRYAGKGRKYFQMWFNNVETFPSTLKNEGRGRKRGNGKKEIIREGKRIFSSVLVILIENLPQHLKN